MALTQGRPERRKLNLRDTSLWDRDLNGYAVCPWCAAMVYSDRADLHLANCAAGPPARRADDRAGSAAASSSGGRGLKGIGLAAALCLGVLAPSALVAQGGQWPTLSDAGIEYLSSSGFLQVSLSGQLDLEAMHVGGAAWAGLVKQRSNTETPPTNWVRCSYCHEGLGYNSRGGRVLAHRLRVFTDIFLGDHLYSLVEVRSDRGHAPSNKAVEVRVEQAYVRLATASGGLGLQVGRFAGPFGSYALRHLTVADPFLRPPLPYEYRTLLVRPHIPGGPGERALLARLAGHLPEPGCAAGVGRAVPGRSDAVRCVGAVRPSVGGDGERPLERPGRLGLRPRPAQTAFMGRRSPDQTEPGPRAGGRPTAGARGCRSPSGQRPPSLAQSWRDFDQEIVSVDVAYARGPLMVRAEAMLDLWEVPAVEDRLRDISYTAELRWDLSAGLWAAGRFGLIDFGPLEGGGRTLDWDRDVYRLEGSLGYRLVRNAGVMLSGYRQNVRGAPGTTFVGARLWYAF